MAVNKKFNWLVAFWKQIGVAVLMFVGQWWSKTYTPEAWAAVEPSFNQLWVTLGGIVAAWDAASVAVKNQARKMEDK